MRINMPAVFFLVVLQQVISFFWYSSLLFRQQWILASGVAPDSVSMVQLKVIVSSVVASLIFTWLLAWFFSKMNINTGPKGIVFSFAIWFAFSFLITLPHFLFSGMPGVLLYIESGRLLVLFLITGFVLGIWTKTRYFF